MTRHQFKPCDRCGRRGTNLAAMAEWNVVVELGAVTGLICDRCQSSEEYTEAEVNHATIDYKVIDGLLAGSLKGTG